MDSLRKNALQAAYDRWSEAHYDAALSEGWSLFSVEEPGRELEIERCDEIGLLDNDGSAIQVVREGLAANRPHAVEAVRILREFGLDDARHFGDVRRVLETHVRSVQAGRAANKPNQGE